MALLGPRLSLCWYGRIHGQGLDAQKSRLQYISGRHGADGAGKFSEPFVVVGRQADSIPAILAHLQGQPIDDIDGMLLSQAAFFWRADVSVRRRNLGRVICGRTSCGRTSFP